MNRLAEGIAASTLLAAAMLAGGYVALVSLDRQDKAQRAEGAIEKHRIETEQRIERGPSDVWRRICEDGTNYVDGVCK